LSLSSPDEGDLLLFVEDSAQEELSREKYKGKSISERSLLS